MGFSVRSWFVVLLGSWVFRCILQIPENPSSRLRMFSCPRVLLPWQFVHVVVPLSPLRQLGQAPLPTLPHIDVYSHRSAAARKTLLILMQDAHTVSSILYRDNNAITVTFVSVGALALASQRLCLPHKS